MVSDTTSASPSIAFVEDGFDVLPTTEGSVVAFWASGESGPRLGAAAAKLDALTDGQAARALSRAKGDAGETTILSAPHGLRADALILICTGSDALDALGARSIGAALAKALASARAKAAHVRLEGLVSGEEAAPAPLAAEVAFGLRLRAYAFSAYKTEAGDVESGAASFAGAPKAEAEAAFAPLLALSDGVALTRDLVNEPANVLTPIAFSERAASLSELGVEIEVLDEPALEKIGMRTLLAVGQGSENPSRVVAMRWTNAADRAAAPVCLIGKGVCFDTGGVSLKPAAGMEEMTMDMGGAGVVVGAMRALAQRKSKVNVVGLIGLVENMPDGKAQRPGDIVVSLSGKTVEIINTDAEGRLVLADLIWHAQDVYKPQAMIDYATLTGAVIVALGHHNAGLFANDDALAQSLLGAAEAEGEGLWRLPLGEAYDKSLKSRLADMKNTGGRAAGSITAAQFLQRFVRDGAPWAHIDIAGVALTKEDGAYWPKGPSGWGVATTVRFVERRFGAEQG